MVAHSPPDRDKRLHNCRMPLHPTPRLLLLDFDGVLAHYDRPKRLLHLAEHAGCTPAQVQAALFDSGLETAYDSGAIDTATYLETLGQGIGRIVDPETWIAARLVACRPCTGVLERIAALAGQTAVAVLTNNGPLMAQAIERLVPQLFPALQGRVLCSGQFGGRKPQREVFQQALALLAIEPRHTLFVDDLFVNVRGARAAGLHADTVRDARSFARVLRRHRLPC